MKQGFLGPEDIVTHAGDDYSKHLGAIIPPIYQTSLFTSKEISGGYYYSRASNPTVELAEVKIAALEGAERGLCFSSGMAAISAGILHYVKSGSHVVMHRNAYVPTQHFVSRYLARFGVTVTFVAAGDCASFEAAFRPETSLVYLESPSTFLFQIQDIEAIARAARLRGIATMVDNTWATPLHQNPLALGADLVAHSASKYLGGHSDLVAGALAGKADTLETIARNERDLIGSCMDPHQAWLLTRGLRTLPLRMEKHAENTRKVVAFLQQHSQVTRILWPGLEDHPDRALIDRQMKGSSGLFSFVPKFGRVGVEKFLKTLSCFEVGPSWGGFESLAISPGLFMAEAERTEMAIPDNLIRVSIGLENLETILSDLDSALQGSRA